MRQICLIVLVICFSVWTQSVKSETVPENTQQMQLSFAPVVKQTSPAVVNIYAKKIVKVQQQRGIFAEPFFKQFFGNQFSFGAPIEKVQNSLGSGVIVDPHGTIVTNTHVIDNTTDIRIVLSDRREFPAQVVAADKRTDLAVLKIDTAGATLPYLTPSSTDGLEVGDLVLAVGNPFGVGQTVTSGIISALARTTVGITDYQFFIQTDAAVNPGNSGGALVDINGNLIGINTAIYSRDGGSLGIGFAIPAEMVKSVLASVDQSGKVLRPWLGVSTQIVTNDLAQSLGLPAPSGVLITALHPKGPAKKAGLKVGDLILTINGKEVNDPQTLKFLSATAGVGNTAQLTLRRGQMNLELPLALEEAPEDPPRNQTVLGGQGPFIGLVVANLSPAVTDELGLDTTLEGVVVMGAKSRSPATRLGLRRGDIISKVNDFGINNVDKLRKVSKRDYRQWVIQVQRGTRTLTVTVR